MPPREGDLGSSELEVLNLLWSRSPQTVRDVLNGLHQRGRKVAYTTVLTFLTRLEQKGFVKSDKSGVAYEYCPTVSRDKVTKSRLQTMLDTFYDGAAGPLALQLMREERFTADEIAELRRLVDSLDNSGSDASDDNGRRGR